MDLVLELLGNRLCAVEIKRGLAPKIEPGTDRCSDCGRRS
jgi:hypothetical protein